MIWSEFKYKSRKRFLMRKLIAANCNVTKAAQMANVNRTAFYQILNKYDIDVRQLANDLLSKSKPEIVRQLRTRIKQSSQGNWEREIPGYNKPERKGNLQV